MTSKEELISSIDARMSSRFMHGEKLPTLHILASSKRTDQSFLETCIDMKKKNECKTEFSNKIEQMGIADNEESFKIIKQDLDRLETLEKENQELKEKCKMLEENEEAVLTTLEISVKENARLKKVIEILKKMCSLNNNKTLETEECFLRLTQEEYDLLKEVLDDDK